MPGMKTMLITFALALAAVWASNNVEAIGNIVGKK